MSIHSPPVFCKRVTKEEIVLFIGIPGFVSPMCSNRLMNGVCWDTTLVLEGGNLLFFAFYLCVVVKGDAFFKHIKFHKCGQCF